MLVYPPPHYILYEPLNDKETRNLWESYKQEHSQCEFEEVDASQMFSVDTFSPWFDTWITTSSRKMRILIIWHSHFLTYACQQMLRRQLEQRSFKNRVWFHIEDPLMIQPALISRCIVKRIPTLIIKPSYKEE